MAITINLEPAIEAQIAAQATQQDLSIETFVQQLLTQSVVTAHEPDDLSLEEFEETLDQMFEGTENLVLPYSGTHSREDIY